MRRASLVKMVVSLSLIATLTSFLPATAVAQELCGNKPVTIKARASNSTTLGTQGDDVIMGTEGKDTIKGRGGNDIICGLGGEDILEGNNGNDVIFGGTHSDTLKGGNGADILWGGGGPDYLYGYAGRDTLHGEAGNDQMWGGGERDVMTGGDGDDRMFGGTWADTIHGGTGNDLLNGEDGTDKLFGQDGNDRMNGGNGIDTYTGGSGTDTCTDTSQVFPQLPNVCETMLGGGNTAYVHSMGACERDGQTVVVRISNDGRGTNKFRVQLTNLNGELKSAFTEVFVPIHNSAVAGVKIQDGAYRMDITNVAGGGKPATAVLTNRRVTTTCGRAQPVRDGFVALGDSYSSGYGVGAYDWGTNNAEGTGNNCQRSAAAYSRDVWRQWTQLDFNFRACQGATTNDFYTSRDLREDGVAWGEQPQLDSLNNDTFLVTLTIGGNDLGFSTIVQKCIEYRLKPGSCEEDQLLNTNLAAGMGALEDSVYPALFRDIRRRAPHAKVVVVGYPALFTFRGDADGVVPLDKDEIWIRRQTIELNWVLKRVAAGFDNFVYVDTMVAFAGHEFSAANDDVWFFPARSGAGVHPGAMHPTAAGHDAIAGEIVKELMEDPTFVAMR